MYYNFNLSIVKKKVHGDTNVFIKCENVFPQLYFWTIAWKLNKLSMLFFMLVIIQRLFKKILKIFNANFPHIVPL